MRFLNEVSTKAYISGKGRIAEMVSRAKNIVKEEKGASDVLALIIIIGLVLAIALVFRKQIIRLVASLWNTFVAGGDIEENTKPAIDQWNSTTPNP